MCLAVPGKVTQLDPEGGLGRTGKVSFGGVLKQVHFDLLPEAKVGDYVLVHVGAAPRGRSRERGGAVLGPPFQVSDPLDDTASEIRVVLDEQ